MAAPQVAAHALLWAGAGVEPVRMLNEMKAAGYAGVECNPIGSPERTKELFEERGLRLAASHIPLDRLEELLESHIHYLQAMGAQFLCVSGWNLEGAEAYRRAGRR